MGPGWRRLRTAVRAVVLVLVLAVVLGLSVLTRFPEASILEQAQEWPLVGPAARAFRERYLGRSTTRPRPVSAARTETGSEPEHEPEIVVITGEAREQVWVAEGAVLRAEPREDAEALGTIPAMTNVSLLQRRGDWAWVDYHGAVGWVVPVPVSDQPGLGSRPSPVLPLKARPPDEEMLGYGLRSFPRTPEEYALGAYRLHGEAVGSAVLDRCRELEARLESAYLETFGLSPVGEPAEVVLLYPGRSSYDTFWRLATDTSVASIGRVDRGVVATFIGDRSADEVCTTLMHELTHLVNRRAVGPALPPWLEEGIATELAAGLADAPLDKGLARLAAHRGTLPKLAEFLELDRAAFHIASMRRLHYDLSGLWIHFLLDQEDLAEGFRSFLRYVSEGGPYAPGLDESRLGAERETVTLADDLAVFLGLELVELDARFRRWLEVG